MKIGGPAESGIDKDAWSTMCCEDFIAELERRSAARGSTIPLDFYSWHRYDGPEDMRNDANRARDVLSRSTRYRKTLNICDEWNLTVDNSRVGKIGLAEGAANTLATMISWQDSGLDGAVYYDAQLTGGFNGLWYKPYLDLMTGDQQSMMELMAAYAQGGIPAVTEVQRRILEPYADTPNVPLGGYWAMRAFSAVASHGKLLAIQRGTSVPASVYALASRDASGGAIAIVNNANKTAKVRVGAIPFPAPVTMCRVKGSNTAGAAVTPVASTLSGDSVDLTLDPYEIVLIGTGGGMQ